MAKAGSGWHRVNRNTPATLARRARYKTPEHRAARAAFAALIAAGQGYCWRCKGWIPPGTPGRAWHVGHNDAGTRIMGPEHARKCNLRAAAIKGQAAAAAKRKAATFVRARR